MVKNWDPLAQRTHLLQMCSRVQALICDASSYLARIQQPGVCWIAANRLVTKGKLSSLLGLCFLGCKMRGYSRSRSGLYY